MKRFLGTLTIVVAGCVAAGVSTQAPVPPAWAYPVPVVLKAPPDDGKPQSVPGSTKTFTRSQVRDLFSPPDWHPNDHPPMPEVVAQGRKPEVRACGFCHLPNGVGHPINASLAGLPAAYIVQQMVDYKNGLRKGSDPRISPHNTMIAIAKASTDAEIQQAASYFSSLPLVPYVKVVEASTVPKSRVGPGTHLPAEEGGTEPLGQRILEMPEDVERFDLRDARVNFVAYVPAGSIKRGQALATTGGNGKTVRCATCHGPDLKGLGPVPGLAGRSPSFIVRQMFDMKHGARAGAWSALMKETVANLTDEDMLVLAAYIASLKP
jgi:cytochrome c553